MKQYFIGFLKGLKIFLLYFFIIAVVVLIRANFFTWRSSDFQQALNSVQADEGMRLLTWLLAVVIVGYLIKKHRLMKAWIFLGLIFGIYVVPFMMAAFEVEKSKKNKRNK